MKNIHVLPTDKPSRFYSTAPTATKKEGYAFGEHYIPNTRNMFSNHNIYITSDEEIKDVRPHKGKWHLEKGQILNKLPTYLTDLPECKLVIMTTDQDLIKDGVQAIDDEFLELFVKNPSCEEVKVELHVGSLRWSDSKNTYKIIIQQEEESKKETLEEIANKLSIKEAKDLDLFLKGIEWQKEKDRNKFSEEEVELIANEMVNWAIDNIGNPFPQSGKKFDEVMAKFRKE
jgi:hypothetical protein